MSRTTAGPAEAGQVAARPGVPVGVSAAAGLGALVAVLTAFALTVGVGRAAWVVGVGCGVVLVALLARAVAGAGRAALGPADAVTLGRGLMACAAAALTVELMRGQDVTVALVALAAPGLALDAVDGRVARRTGTVTALGGRFDGEVDAFLILVLSVAAAPWVGWWVLAGGLARYVFGVAGWLLPWMRGSLDFRYWRKVVTASTGIVLVVAVAGVLPRGLTLGAVVGVHVLLAESFGRDVRSLWRSRERAGRSPVGRSSRIRAVLAGVLVVALLWFVLVVPNQPAAITLGSMLRIPVEAVVVAGLALVVPGRWRWVMAVVVGVLLAVVGLLKVLDLATFAVLDRPFNVVTDLGLPSSGLAFVRDSFGPWAAVGTVAAAVVLVGVLAVGLPWAVARFEALVSRDRGRGIRVAGVLAAAWALCSVTGFHIASGVPVAANGVGPFAAGKITASVTAYEDRERFEAALADDSFRNPAPGRLVGLSGKNVVVVFVESYGRVALEGAESQPVRTLLDSGTDRLRRLGFTARSGFLTSPTFGGSSWLAHSTLQSGLAVTDQTRYDRLLTADRTTLTSAFGREGWRTVAVMPSTHGNWPEGQDFYEFDKVYDGAELRYAGPSFGFSAMPDQYALSSFAELELGRETSEPVMAVVELTSSHGLWAPLPTMVDPDALGDGSIFYEVKANATTAAELWRDRAVVPTAYRQSIVYSLSSVLAFVEQEADDDLVVILLGDHQPSTIVSGFGGNRDVPVSVIARDPHVIEQISSWGWQDGLRPGEGAPVWPMADFRDRFIGAFSGVGATTANAGSS